MKNGAWKTSNRLELDAALQNTLQLKGVTGTHLFEFFKCYFSMGVSFYKLDIERYLPVCHDKMKAVNHETCKSTK